MTIHPDALADLRRSGLGDETIAAAGLHTPPREDLERWVSPRLAQKVDHVLVFPYPGAEPFYRVKLFPALPDGQGHTIRYYQPAGSAARLYLPPRARAALADPTVPLFITEGEKKALRADQAGLACVGLGGLWNWRHAGVPVADLDRIDWFERETVLAPDADVWTRAELLQPVFALGKELEARGAKVSVLKLPANANVSESASESAGGGAGGAKVGLDDYLSSEPAEQLAKLPRLDLRHALFARTAAWWREWTKRAAAPPAARAPTVLELLQRPEAVRVLHPAQDVADGVLWYGLPVDGALVLITSERQAHRADRLPEGIALRHADPGPSSVSRDAAVRWLTAGEAGSVAQALDGLAAFIARYVVLRDRRAALWVGAWALATWCHRAFRVFPYLWVRSAEKRCGKSRLLGLLARVGFNASPVTAHPTEAQLYRGAARTGGVQLFDEVESLRGDRDRLDALITVLNVGFERGGVVTRLEKRGERFVETPYEVYAPRVLAGIAGLKDTLEDRALPLVMLRRRSTEPVARLGRATDAEAQALRDQCALACLTHIGAVLREYERAPGVLEREGIDDRAVDLWSPLVAVAAVADAQDAGGRARALLEVAREQGSAREADAETGHVARLLEALEAIRAEQGEMLAPGELLSALQARPGWEWVRTGRRLAGLLSPLGIVRRQLWNGGQRRWCYLLDTGQIADLRARYGAGGALAEDGPGAVSGSPHSPETGAIR